MNTKIIILKKIFRQKDIAVYKLPDAKWLLFANAEGTKVFNLDQLIQSVETIKNRQKSKVVL
jgi:hypothetical protein